MATAHVWREVRFIHFMRMCSWVGINTITPGSEWAAPQCKMFILVNGPYNHWQGKFDWKSVHQQHWSSQPDWNVIIQYLSPVHYSQQFYYQCSTAAQSSLISKFNPFHYIASSFTWSYLQMLLHTVQLTTSVLIGQMDNIMFLISLNQGCLEHLSIVLMLMSIIC